MTSFCDYYNSATCRSCTRIELDYETQVTAKLEVVRGLLPDSANILLPPVLSPIKAFRNKAKFVVTGTLEHPTLGLAGETDLDQGRELLHCPVHHPVLNATASDLVNFIRVCQLRPYHMRERKGELKGLILYYSPESDELYLKFVLRSKESIDRLRKHLPEFLISHPRIRVVAANIQPVPHAILEGEEEIILTEHRVIHHRMGNVSYLLGPKGFVQTNQTVATKLYATAAAWTAEMGTKVFVELFSGHGGFSFFVAPSVQRAVGVETDPAAVATASASAKMLNLNHVSFLAADAGAVSGLVNEVSPDLILVNPPRRGLGSAVDVLKDAAPKHIIYSSCQFETFVKDLEALGNDYELKRLQLFDLFPHTEHFETLSLLQRRR